MKNTWQVHWCRMFWYERFRACFALKLTLQRGEGGKGRQCNKTHRTFPTRISCTGVMLIQRFVFVFVSIITSITSD